MGEIWPLELKLAKSAAEMDAKVRLEIFGISCMRLKMAKLPVPASFMHHVVSVTRFILAEICVQFVIGIPKINNPAIYL